MCNNVIIISTARAACLLTNNMVRRRQARINSICLLRRAFFLPLFACQRLASTLFRHLSSSSAFFRLPFSRLRRNAT